MIRPATLQDIGTILNLANDLVRHYPIRADEERMRKVATEAISSKKHFAWVVEKDNGVHGMLIALTSDNLWGQRMNCNIVAWVSHVPGEGVKLLRKFTEFVNSRRGIKVAGMCVDTKHGSDRVRKLLHHVGFRNHGAANYIFN